MKKSSIYGILSIVLIVGMFFLQDVHPKIMQVN